MSAGETSRFVSNVGRWLAGASVRDRARAHGVGEGWVAPLFWASAIAQGRSGGTAEDLPVESRQSALGGPPIAEGVFRLRPVEIWPGSQLAGRAIRMMRFTTNWRSSDLSQGSVRTDALLVLVKR